MTPTQEKLALQAKIERDTAEFLAKGGQIQRIPIGMFTEHERSYRERILRENPTIFAGR